MPNSRIRILTGPTRSGKTTAIAAAIEGMTTVEGFLTPDMDGLRKLVHLCTGEVVPFQVAERGGEDDVLIGRFIFTETAFEHARRILLQLCCDTSSLIVVDEIGKLELDGRGFEPALGTFLQFHTTSGTPLLLVVRDYLLADVIEKYGLHHAEIMEHETGTPLNL